MDSSVEREMHDIESEKLDDKKHLLTARGVVMLRGSDRFFRIFLLVMAFGSGG